MSGADATADAERKEAVPAAAPRSADADTEADRDAFRLILHEAGVLCGHERSISALKFSPDGALLASASADRSIRVWDVARMECRAVLRGHARGISDISWSPDSELLASAGDDGVAMLWRPLHVRARARTDAQGDEPVRTLHGHSNYVFAVVFGPTGGLLATGSFDESIRVWDARAADGRCLRTIAAHADPVTGLSFGPDGSLLASSSYDGLMYAAARALTARRRVWDTATGRCLKTIVDDDNPAVYARARRADLRSGVRFSVNGKYLLAPTLDSTIRLWSVHTGRCVKSYTGHVNVKYCIVPSFVSVGAAGGADARSGADVHIVSGSEDGRVLAWNLNSRARILDEKVHETAVMAVAVHPTRPLLATAALEPDLRVRVFSYAG